MSENGSCDVPFYIYFVLPSPAKYSFVSFTTVPESRNKAIRLGIAGLVAEGITVIDDIYFIERGYEEFDQKLRGIGAQIEKVSDEKEIQKFILKVS